VKGGEILTNKEKIRVECAYDEMVALKDLKPHPKNPNKHPKKQLELLKKIIEKNGWRVPITVSERSGYIVRGHARYEVAKMLKMEKVPVDFQRYGSEEEELSDLLADNRISELASIDKDELREILEELSNIEDFDIELTGYTSQDLEKLMEKKEEDPEVEFTQELLEEHNYVVLYFDNEVDWQQACSLFDIKTVKSLDEEKWNKGKRRGIGRVLNGREAINKILRARGKE